MRHWTYKVICLCFVFSAFVQAAPPVVLTWELVPELTDEFDQFDALKWHNYHPGWDGRDPSQFSTENVLIQDGKLGLRSTSRVRDLSQVKDPNRDIWVNAAAVSSIQKSAQPGYYYETRIKASDLSMTSSFWFRMGHFSEIDVIENIGRPSNPAKAHFATQMKMNTHLYRENPAISTPKDYEMGKNSRDHFITFGLWWKDPNELRFYCNDKLVNTVYPAKPFDESLHMIFDTEVFTWVGLPSIAALDDPARNTMWVDWVRTWRPVAQAVPTTQQVHIDVDPYSTRQIGGISELRRESYFSLCDQGTQFDQRCQNEDMYRYLVKDLDIRFGRLLGPVRGVVRWKNAVFEDPLRPGYVDLDRMANKLLKDPYQPSDLFQGDIGNNLDVAAHGSHNAFPEYMGKYQTAQSDDEWLPLNMEAAAELSVATMLYNYVEFDRPAFYELINEPHWSFYGTTHLAHWHQVTQSLMRTQGVPVQVGGPCSSVAYFYRDGYRSFNGMRDFIDQTECQLDFYSFHVYDYLHWDGEDFNGRITTGLPLEGMIDLVQNYTRLHYGKEVPLVVSEHGGYINDGKTGGYHGAAAADAIAQIYFPGEGFTWEMKKRSIVDHVMVSSVIANTLTFMEHPHVVKKAVPFILLQAFGWDPKYYAVLYVPEDYQDKTVWVPTHMVDFYRLFKGVQGRRVVAHCPDPDIQTRAFVDRSILWVVMNNLSNQLHTLSLDLPGARATRLRRLKRHFNFTPIFVEEEGSPSDDIVLEGRGTVVLKVYYSRGIAARQVVNEQVYYGDRVVQSIATESAFYIKISEGRDIAYALLRIGLQRAASSGRQVQVTLNGHVLEVPLEDCVDRLDDGERDYATCKLIPVDPSLIHRGGRNDNRVVVSFTDGGAGSIGSVVLRAAIVQ
ncbi:hypothetical protein ACFL6U_14640 [Planctomycetota bacterium]